MSPPKYVKHHKEQVLSKACAPALSALAGPHLTKGMTSLAEGDRGYGSELPCNWHIRSCKVYVRKNCETFVQINLINDICEPVDPGRFGSDVRLGQRYEDRSVSRATAKMTLSKTWKKQVLCNTYNNKNSFTIHTRFGTTFLAPPPHYHHEAGALLLPSPCQLQPTSQRRIQMGPGRSRMGRRRRCKCFVWQPQWSTPTVFMQ